MRTKGRVFRSQLSPSAHSNYTFSLFIRIADITYAIVSFDPSLRIQVIYLDRNFLIHEANPDLTIGAGWDDLSKRQRGKKVFDSGGLWQLYKYNGKYSFSFTSPVFGSIPYKVALVNKDFTSAEVLLHRPYFNTDQPIYPLEYPLDELLFINLLSFGKGVEIHACGVKDSLGRGHLFVGQSGAGKSTMARLWQGVSGVTVLSDDRIVLRKLSGKIWMYGTPWHGDAGLASPGRAPLSRVYFLKHGPKNEILKQGPVESMTRLFTCSFLPFYSSEALDFTLGFFEEVVKAIPCHEIRFLPDRRITEFILSAEHRVLGCP